MAERPLPAGLMEKSLLDLASRTRVGAFYYPLVAVAVAGGTTLWQDHPAGCLGFLCLQMMLALLRYMLCSDMMAGRVNVPQRWQGTYLLTAIVVAGTMGMAGGWCLYSVRDAYGWLMVLLAASGLSAAASLGLAPSPPAQRAFLLALFAPLLVATLLHGGMIGLSVLAAAYLGVCWLLAQRAADWYAEALQDNFMLSAQTDRLKLAHQETAEAAARLAKANDQLNHQAEELKRITQLNSSLLEAAGEGILGLDAQGHIRFANPRAAAALGRRVEDLLGQPVHLLLHAPHDHGRCQPPCPEQTRLLSPEATAPVTARFFTGDGSSFPAEAVCSPLSGNAGTVVIFKDISDRLAVDRMKDEFVSVVSHELRTPLTAIKGPLGLLAGGYLGTLSEKGKRLMEVAVANADRLIRLVNDILDYERLESGKASLDPAPVDIGDLLAQAEIVVRPLLAQAEVQLVQLADSGSILVDASRIVQVLTNLIGNAIKFSPPGAAIGLNVGLQPETVTFEVADQGRGIPPEQLERIFERFHQVNASDERDRGGTGLGLAITRSIVHRHGGRIWVESTMGKGSSFFFTLPLGVPSVLPLVSEVST